jgi:hypothetical protein
MIEKLRDGFRQELKQGLIALQFKTVRELIEAAQALKACIEEGQQSHGGVRKRKDMEFSGKPPLPKKGKGRQFFQFKKRRRTLASSRQNISSRTVASEGSNYHNCLPFLFIVRTKTPWELLGFSWPMLYILRRRS